MRKLFIYGAGSVGREVCDIAERLNMSQPKWEEIGFIDDTKSLESFIGKRIFNYSTFRELFQIDSVEVIVANGEPAARKTLFSKLRTDGYQLANVVDSTAIVVPSAQLGDGVIIYPGTFISANARICDNVLIYNHTTVAHDSVIGNSSVLSIGVIVAGNSTISDHCFIGAGATVRERIVIGEWSIVAMSAVVCKSTPAEGIYMGNPAKRVRENISRRVFK